MVSIRNASIVVAASFVGALGLMGCVNEGRAQSQTPATASTYDPSASSDPSNLYTPSSDSNALAVSPPPTVTGRPGNEGTTNTTKGCVEVGSAAAASPNRRLCP